MALRKKWLKIRNHRDDMLYQIKHDRSFLLKRLNWNNIELLNSTASKEKEYLVSVELKNVSDGSFKYEESLKEPGQLDDTAGSR
ncbi:hypothetical protein MKW98_023399 [Papaver atlanticum]|uniref:Uncharacterized protein n=1 Tax=Papaver atlanticum TaxID=357466 RepID=A0AAD4SWL4_9MAGN|nr:hypothetical protein MKW98_023399 [Papaver atlanticum]